VGQYFITLCQDFETHSVNETPASGIQALIEKLDLKPHPEGGSYREFYRSPRARADGSR
jgi:predicted cupin superfamily sugar epimerase